MLANGLTTWRREKTPDLTNIGLGGISCPRPTTCYVVGSGGAILKGS